MPTASGHRRDNISTRRLEAFTDGVFAIAATLLVLDLSVDGFTHISSSAALWDALSSLQSNIFSFLISFLLLCLLWSVHSRQFEHVTHADSTVVVVNSLRLLTVVMIPFSTSINSTYGEIWLGRVFLPANFFLVVLLGSIQWFYLTGRGKDLIEGVSAARMRETRRGTVVATVVAALVVVLAPFIGAWAFALFIVNGPVDRVMQRMTERRVAHGDEAAG